MGDCGEPCIVHPYVRDKHDCDSTQRCEGKGVEDEFCSDCEPPSDEVWVEAREDKTKQ